MDALQTPKRMPLGLLDHNKRNTPVSSLKQTRQGKSSAENAVLGKRVANELLDENNELEMKQATPNKKRKVDSGESESNAETSRRELPTIEVDDCEPTKTNSPGGIDEPNSTTRPLSRTQSFESSQQTLPLPPNSQETNITDPDPENVHEISTRPNARQQAHALRLRLKMAMYRISTNQTTVPLGQLELRTSSLSKSTRNSRQNTPSISTRAVPSSQTALVETSGGEALLIENGKIISQPSFRSSFNSTTTSMSVPRQSGTTSAYRSYSEQTRISQYNRDDSVSHAHPRLVPYAAQKRKASLGSNSDIDSDLMDLPRRRMMPSIASGIRNMDRPLEASSSFDKDYVRGSHRAISRSFDGGYKGERFDNNGSNDEVNIIRPIPQDKVSRPTPEAAVDARGGEKPEKRNSADEVDAAAGGLLELMSQGRASAS